MFLRGRKSSRKYLTTNTLKFIHLTYIQSCLLYNFQIEDLMSELCIFVSSCFLVDNVFSWFDKCSDSALHWSWPLTGPDRDQLVFVGLALRAAIQIKSYEENERE